LPQYYFQSVDDEEIYTDIFFTFKDAPRIGTIIDYEGEKWRRMPTLPQAASSTLISPFDNKAFVEKTGKMKGTWGQLENFSREMSEQRTKIAGRDEVLERHEASREKLTGLKSFRKKKIEAQESLAKKGIVLE
jgi:hypothetical protein